MEAYGVAAVFNIFSLLSPLEVLGCNSSAGLGSAEVFMAVFI